MATSNRRVAAYLPNEIDEAFKAFKIKNRFSSEDEPNSNDSKALIEIIRQFLDVEHRVAHSVSLPDNLVTEDQVKDLRKEFDSKLSELLSESKNLIERLERVEGAIETSKTLSTNELAKRLNMPSSSLSHWKSSGSRGKTPEQLLKATREKDPDGIGWILLRDINKFKPEKPLLSSSLSNSQGELSMS